MTSFLKSFYLPGLPFILLLAACQRTPTPVDNQAAHAFAARGVIEKIAPDRRQVTIHHETIPGYMIEMTMDFSVDDPRALDGLVPGDKVAFTLHVDTDRAWVSDFNRIGHTDATMNGMSSMDTDESTKLKPGDLLPDAELLTEDGRSIHLSDFRGKVVALTFFFTRCPLPNYCPLMNRNFSQTRDLLLADSHAPTNWQFLSISFDPDFDRPTTLANYAGFYRHNNADRWLFAAASPSSLASLAAPLGLVVMRQDASISHNLRTIVVDPQGRLFHQFNDNLWTARQLADAILAASHGSPAQ
jgi:protein SCO1/2